MLDFLSKPRRKEQGIWKYADFYAEKISKKDRLTAGDGGTELLECSKIGKKVGVGHLYFKREDENETGSLKGRSLAYQISLNKARGEKAVVISTSGNAGIAAAAYAGKAGMKALIFVSPDTEKSKIAEMQKYDPVIIRSTRAMRLANYASAKYKLPNLRPSLDDESIEGFKSIAFEIADEAGEVDAVFTFTTSGSSFIGMHRGFEMYKEIGKIGKLPKMYAVQAGEIFSVAEEFEENLDLIKSVREASCGSDPAVRAGQCGIKHTKRKKEILEIMNRTSGRGIYASEREIADAEKMLLQGGIQTSAEGCASFAGLMKVAHSEKFRKAVCIFSGQKRSAEKEIDDSEILTAENFEEADKIIKQLI